MYTIAVDCSKKIIQLEVAGYMDVDEVKAFIKELERAIYQFKYKEVSILAFMGRLDPVSQDCLPYLISSVSEALVYTKKIASVHQRVITRMQMERIETTSGKCSDEKIQIKRFTTKGEAMSYLLS